MFLRFVVADECGAVSADWLALGAGLMALALALVGTLTGGTVSLSETTGEAMETAQVEQLGSVGWSD